jgi:ABC-type ATPase involved in cell division
MARFETLNRSGPTVVLATRDAAVAHWTRRIITFEDGAVTGDTARATPEIHTADA